MNNLGVALAGGNGTRRKDDFYPTPAEATHALMLKCDQWIGPVVHEPACGDGAMARIIEGYGRRLWATDLIDRGFGIGGVDFLTEPPAAGSIITNPPFKLAKQFIEHALKHEPEFFAVLLKATFWNAGDRFDMLETAPPKLSMPLTWRVDFTGGGSPTMDCTWFAWGSNIPAGLPPMPLRRPNLGVFG